MDLLAKGETGNRAAHAYYIQHLPYDTQYAIFEVCLARMGCARGRWRRLASPAAAFAAVFGITEAGDE